MPILRALEKGGSLLSYPRGSLAGMSVGERLICLPMEIEDAEKFLTSDIPSKPLKAGCGLVQSLLDHHVRSPTESISRLEHGSGSPNYSVQ